MRTRPDHRDSAFFRQLFFDVIFSISTICALLFCAVNSSQLLLKKVSVLSHLLAVNDSRADAMADFALTGYWTDRAVPQPQYGPDIDACFRDGAFKINLTGPVHAPEHLEDEPVAHVWLRARILGGDSLGPLVWVAEGDAGRQGDGAGSDVRDENYILYDLK
ncbi:hypothetical protein [Desulfogranum japonicum]|uniref:hypothetical protein n=1 Tax=Desulfogranum japonicum TaxID=231447 RepID=UPI0004083C83|nr:hypothetical protein [Desulfogranum japonicum]